MTPYNTSIPPPWNCSRLPYDQVIGKPRRNFFPPEIAKTQEASLKMVFETGEPVRREEIIQFGGKELWVDTNLVPLKNEEGFVTSVLGIARDTTERRKAENELRESELRYRSLFENMMDGFAYCRMLYDENGHPEDFIYLNVNPAFDGIIGTTAVIGKPVTEVFPGIREAFPELFEIYGRVALTGKPESFDLDFKPSKKWLHISVYSPEKEHFVATFEDITERKQYQDEILKAKNRWELTFNAVPDMIAIIDDHFRIVQVNKAMADRLGVSPEQAVGLTLL